MDELARQPMFYKVYCEGTSSLQWEIQFDCVVTGMLIAVDKGFVQVQEYCGLELVLLGQFELLPGVGHLESFRCSQHLDALVKVLPIEVH